MKKLAFKRDELAAADFRHALRLKILIFESGWSFGCKYFHYPLLLI